MSDKKEHIVDDHELDLMELAKILWIRKWFVGKIAVASFLVGLIVALTSPTEYRTFCSLIPEAAGDDGKLGGSLGGLASLAGVDLNGISGNSQTINPALYQSVSKSTPFIMELMEQEYYFSKVEQSISIHDYYMYHFEVGLFGKLMSIPGTLIGWIKGGNEASTFSNIDNEALIITKDQYAIIENLKERVFVEMDWDLSIVTVRVEMQDPVVAAQMVQFTQDYITNYVTEYAILKSQQQLESLEKQYHSKKVEFDRAQFLLASFRDKNQNVTTARFRSEEEKLQAEYNLAFNVYNQLAQQRDALRLQIQENTPVFTVLEPVKIPVERSKPNRIVLLVVYTIFGAFIGVSIVLIRPTLSFLKNYIGGNEELPRD